MQTKRVGLASIAPKAHQIFPASLYRKKYKKFLSQQQREAFATQKTLNSARAFQCLEPCVQKTIYVCADTPLRDNCFRPHLYRDTDSDLVCICSSRSMHKDHID